MHMVEVGLMLSSSASYELSNGGERDMLPEERNSNIKIDEEWWVLPLTGLQ